MPITKHNYLNNLRQQYGPYITNNVFYYGKTEFKISKLKCDLFFLKTCKRETLTPNFVQFKIPLTHQHYQRAIRKCYREILLNEIKIKKQQLTECYRLYKNLKSLIESDLDHDVLKNISTIIKEMSDEKEIIWKETHLKKLNALRELNLPLNNKHSPIYISSIKNYSKRVLTIKELLALRYGLDYVLPIVTFDDETFIANIETLFVNLIGHCSDKKDYDECDIDEAIIYNLTPEQLFVANRLRKHCDTFKQHAKKSILKFKKKTDPIVKTLVNLSKDDSIYITRADKGRAVVILDKLDYIIKMEDILSDTKTFTRLDSDPTIKKEERLQRKLLKLKDSGFITENEYNFARPVGSQPGKAYGLPKIHKAGAPLRPIISACNTFTYKLSKLLARKLRHLRTSPSIVTDTFKFVDELKDLEFINEKIKMVSFDVVSLFTKVPLARTTQLILEKMYGPEHTCLYDKEMKQCDWCTNCKHRSELQWLLDTATKESHFLFNNKIYCQTDGIAMGSPLGPLFADVYMNYLLSKLERRLKHNGVLYFKRYVDDCFSIIRESSDTKKILNILNSFDTDIQFTVENENDNSLPFLDILITRTFNTLKRKEITVEVNSLSTSIYRKPTFTGLLLNWNSFVPHSYKVSAINSMVYRAIRICSSYSSINKEFQFVKDLALANDYPLRFIECQIRKTLNRYIEKSNMLNNSNIKQIKSVDNCSKGPQILIDLPYIGKQTNTLSKQIIDLAKATRPGLHIQPIPRPPRSVTTFFPGNDKTPKDYQSNVVYKISCSECNDSYIGKTIRQAIKRHQEHGAPQLNKLCPVSQVDDPTLTNRHLRRSDRNKNKPKINYFPKINIIEEEEQEKNIERLKKSALYKHHVEKNHLINWTEWEIISKDPNRYRLLVRESLHILQKKPTLNRTICSTPLIVYPEGLQSSKPTVKIKLTQNITPPGGGTNSRICAYSTN